MERYRGPISEKKPEYQTKPHLIYQNVTDILDGAQEYGTRGAYADLVLHLLARANHLALTGDRVIVSQNIPEDFMQYLEVVTGQKPEYARAKVKEPLFTKDLLDANDPTDAQRFVNNPYIQWRPPAEYSRDTGMAMAFTPAERVLQGVVESANDKVHFREVAPRIGMPLTPHQEIIPITYKKDILDAIAERVKRHKGAFIQAPRAGGGLGNVDVRLVAGNLMSKFGTHPEAIQQGLEQWLQEMEEAGNDELIIAPYVQLVASHTVNGFIPHEGKPFIYGVHKQILEEGTNDYMGYEYPAKDPIADEHGQEMVAASGRWFSHLQKDLGYVGPSDVDFFAGELTTVHDDGSEEKEIIVGASESNTRWDGMRFGDQHLARINGWNLRDLEGIDPDNTPSIKAVDHVTTHAENTREVVAALKGKVPLLGITSDKEGVVVMVPPRAKLGHAETALSAIAPDMEAARKMFAQAEDIIKPSHKP
jgi:hypothetical protein